MKRRQKKKETKKEEGKFTSSDTNINQMKTNQDGATSVADVEFEENLKLIENFISLNGNDVRNCSWNTLKSLLRGSHIVKNEFMFRECLDKGCELIQSDNIFDAISLMELYGLDQKWCDKMVDVIVDNFYVTKTEGWCKVILSCPKTMSFIQHFLLQKTSRSSERLPTRRNCVKRKRRDMLFVVDDGSENETCEIQEKMSSTGLEK